MTGAVSNLENVTVPWFNGTDSLAPTTRTGFLCTGEYALEIVLE